MNSNDNAEYCPICGKELPNPQFAKGYPNLVCRECDTRAVNKDEDPPEFYSQHDSGETPVFIDEKMLVLLSMRRFYNDV